MVRSLPSSARRLSASAFVRSSALLGLVAFHVALLWERLSDASILEPVILAKYACGLALLALAVSYKRFVPQPQHGRRLAPIFWLLVLLMHVVDPFDAGERRIGEEIVAVLEAGLTLPLALVLFVAIASGAPRLRSVARELMARAVCTLEGAIVSVPSRGPPLGP